MRLPQTTLGSAMCFVLASGSFAQPANDSCDGATPVSGYATVDWDTTTAVTSGTPNVDCLPRTDGQIYDDVWFRWTAPETGPATVSTCGLTTMDTRLSVFDGGDCAAAAPIACNDDFCAGQSSVSFSANANTTYLVRLGSSAEGVVGSGMVSFTTGIVAGPIASPDGSSNYYLVQASSWDQGEAMGVALGGHLVEIANLDENMFIRDQVLSFDGQPRRAWIGLHSPLQDGVFVWSSGSSTTFRNWIPGEPNNLDGMEYTVEMVNSNGFTGEWNDAPRLHPPTQFALLEVPTVVLCPADLDDNGIFGDGGAPDGAVTIDDLLFFLAGFEEGSGLVDLDDGSGNGVHDGAVTIEDLLFMLLHFEQGC